MLKEMSYNESTSTNEQETPNIFSDYFFSVYLTKHTVLGNNKLGISILIAGLIMLPLV